MTVKTTILEVLKLNNVVMGKTVKSYKINVNNEKGQIILDMIIETEESLPEEKTEEAPITVDSSMLTEEQLINFTNNPNGRSKQDGTEIDGNVQTEERAV